MLDKLLRTMLQMKHEHEQTCHLIAKLERAPESLSQTVRQISMDCFARSQQYKAERSSCLHEIECLSEEAHTACLAAADSLNKAAAEKAEDAQTIAMLQSELLLSEGRIQDALSFKTDLADRIWRARKADQDAIQTLSFRVHALEELLEQSADKIEDVTDGLARLHETLMEHGRARLASKDAHVVALRQLQIQHERLLAELKGREQYIGMMEEMQVDLMDKLLRLESQNREFAFNAQGHTIVHEIEHMHLEQAMSKATAATYAAVEAKCHHERLEQSARQRTQEAKEVENRIANMEKLASVTGAQIEETLTSVVDLIRHRNVVAHARNPLFVPTTGNGAALSTVVAKTVCYLVENAGVPLLARTSAVTGELVTFFSEQFNSWMQEVLELNQQNSDLQAETVQHRSRITQLEESHSELLLELENARFKNTVETEHAWKAIKELTAPQPLALKDAAGSKELLDLQIETQRLSSSLSHLHEENRLLKGELALKSAGFSPTLGTPTLPSSPLSKHGAGRTLAASEDAFAEIERLQEALAQSYAKNKVLLDQADMLCAMKEAADSEVTRLQDQLDVFVSGQAGASLRREVRSTPEHRPLHYSDDDSDSE